MESSAQAERVSIRLILSDRAVVTVIALAFVLMGGPGLVLPILPLYARSVGIGYGEAGILISAYALARLVSDLLSGLAVDRFGERLSACGGLSLMALATLPTGPPPSLAPAGGLLGGPRGRPAAALP